MFISGFKVYSPTLVDRICGIWGSYYHIPEATFYLFKGDYINSTNCDYFGSYGMLGDPILKASGLK